MIRSFDEMKLRESEFEKASALDSSEFENIRNEFFKKTVVHPLIGIIISAAVASLWFTGVIQKLYVISDVITTALMFLVAFCIAMHFERLSLMFLAWTILSQALSAIASRSSCSSILVLTIVSSRVCISSKI